ncbi:MAG: M67 family metallopeptidase [Chloroflexi bacterium]|nr:M67 family metallopeptidase [Chloroflexota bacterium]
MTKLYVAMGVYSEMCNQAADHPAVEVCGLLGGLWKPYDRAAFGQQVVAIPNVAAQPEVTFLMESRAQIQAMTSFAKAGLDIIGIFHSHPQGMDRPSETDIRECAYPDVVYLIVCPAMYAEWDADRPPTVFGMVATAWRIKNGEASAVTLVVSE